MGLGEGEIVSTNTFDHVFKVVVVGDSGVGKSALLNRYADFSFVDTYTSTIGVDFKLRTRNIEGRKVKMQVWDTAGQERFRTITTCYYRGAQGILVVFDVTNRQSFNNVKMWFSEIDKHVVDRVQLILIGNKSDLTCFRCVDTKEGADLASQFGAHFIETSAKNASNVDKAFDDLASRLLARESPGRLVAKEDHTQKPETPPEKKSKWCCL